ncbi:Oxalate--CoA ligase [Podosphaera aphanis]|nr:Oxalate--CoA ligase [Podosphaera aphanis]
MATSLQNFFAADNDATAIIIPGKPPLNISYQDLSAQVWSFQNKLAQLGLTPGAAVSISLLNSYEFVVSFLAICCQRGIAAPLNPAYKLEEVEFYINDLESAIILVPKGFYSQNGPAIQAANKSNVATAECYWNGKEVVLDVKNEGKLQGKGNQALEKSRPDDVALVLHTSGTTGRPKAVPLSHKNLLQSMKNIQNTYALCPRDKGMLVMPLFHVHGLLAGLLAPLYSGGSIVIPSRFSAREFWSDFVKYEANWYTAVPTIHQILLKFPFPNPKPYIRFIRSCSSPLSPTTFHALEEKFGAPVLEAYAMTEAAHQMSSNPLPPGRRQPGSVGIAQGLSMKILDDLGNEVPHGHEGEICIRGENVTAGYLNNPSANESSFTKHRFFRTGDQGKIDGEGYVFITGRIKELINKGGEKISPIELDNMLARHPKVDEAVSFAVPDEIYGQEVAVAIVPKKDLEVSPEEIQAWVEEKLAKFKVPKQVYFTDVMPKTATGKIQRRIVAVEMAKRLKRSSKL